MARAIAVNVKTKKEETNKLILSSDQSSKPNIPVSGGSGGNNGQKESTKPVPEESASNQSTHAENVLRG